MLPDSTRKSFVPSPTRQETFKRMSAPAANYDSKENTMEVINPLKTPSKPTERLVEPATTVGKQSSINQSQLKIEASLNETADVENGRYTPKTTMTQVKTSWIRSKPVRYVIIVTVAVLIAAALVGIGAGGEYLFVSRQKLNKEKHINNALDYTNFLVLPDKPDTYETS